MKIESILELEYKEPQRPYSKLELNDMRKNLYKQLKLSSIKSHHSKCDHFYYVKENGRKEKEIKEKDTEYDVGNCSCCWKLHNTPNYLKNKAYEMVVIYNNTFKNEKEDSKYNYTLLDLETTFYKWLYLDNYDEQNSKKFNKR